MNPSEFEKSVPPELSGYRLDQALARMFPEFSRSRLKAWVLSGDVTVDGRTSRPRDPVAGGERIRVVASSECETDDEAQPMPIALAYEDDAVIVVDKPAGLVVHPGAGNRAGTLLNGLLHRFPELAAVPRAGIVHRLDRDTTGLLLVARTLEAHTSLVRQLAERRIGREYDAVCAGVLTGGGRIDAPLGRHRVDRKRMTVRDDGKPAVTHYRVAKRYAAHTWVKASLETGRTHQIRVHFAWRRMPLVGDKVYGGRLAIPAGCTPELAATLRAFGRQALAATRLEFAHPSTDRRIEVVIEPPEDLRTLLAALEADVGRRGG